MGSHFIAMNTIHKAEAKTNDVFVPPFVSFVSLVTPFVSPLVPPFVPPFVSPCLCSYTFKHTSII